MWERAVGRERKVEEGAKGEGIRGKERGRQRSRATEVEGGSKRWERGLSKPSLLYGVGIGVEPLFGNETDASAPLYIYFE